MSNDIILLCIRLALSSSLARLFKYILVGMDFTAKRLYIVLYNNKDAFFLYIVLNYMMHYIQIIILTMNYNVSTTIVMSAVIQPVPSMILH